MSKQDDLSQCRIDEERMKNRAIRKAKIYTNCSITAAFTVDMLHGESMDVDTLLKKICDSVQQINEGNMQEVEEMLVTQAHTLNVLFHRCLSQVGNSEWVPQIEAFSDIALKAQNQCRKTLAVLASIKHPNSATFIKQQNNAVNQQVNNQVEIENKKNVANELLEVCDGKRLDTRAASTTITADLQMAAMEVSRG